jgi:hypothetical protein
MANEAAKIGAALCAQLVHRVRAKHPITFELRFGEELVRGAFVRERFAPLEVLVDVARFIAITHRLDMNDNAVGYEPCLFVNRINKRTPESRQHVIDLFSQKLKSALAQDPKKYSCRWVLHLMLILKNQK